MVKKHWDLVCGFIVGLALSFTDHFGGEKVRLYSSVIILILACMGLFRFIRQAIDKEMKKRKDKRESNLLDVIVDNQLAVKAIGFAQDPTKEVEQVGKLFMKLWEVNKKIMKKIKELFSKYKGYMLTIALGVLTLVEQYGGYINEMMGGKLVIKGVEVIPLITLIASIVVGILSNGYTKDQMTKIKALFSKSSTSELVTAEIRKSIKENTAKYAQLHKTLATKETELENLQSEYESLGNTYNAKKEMYNMTPQLATDEDVQLAFNAWTECEAKINSKAAEITEIDVTMDNLSTTISALKSQL